jgi:hypothetical protein
MHGVPPLLTPTTTPCHHPCHQTGNTNYVVAVAYAPPGFLPGLDNGAVISGAWWLDASVPRSLRLLRAV